MAKAQKSSAKKSAGPKAAKKATAKASAAPAKKAASKSPASKPPASKPSTKAKAASPAASKTPMSKSTPKATATKTTSAGKAAPKAAAPSKAAPSKAAPKAAAPAKPSSSVRSSSSTNSEPAPRVIPVDPAYARAHPDAKLTKMEVSALFHRLVDEKKRVLGNFERHVDDALADEDLLADEIDIAQRSTDQAWLFRMADKDRKLLIEIDAALEKLRNAEYGVCEGTDEPIGFKRLELRPWTRYSVAYKELLEREKAQQAR